MKHIPAPFLSRNVLFLMLLLIFLASLFQLNSWGLTESSEARYAQIAKEMYQSGNYLHPTKMGILHYHKPPLTYQITALGYQIFGVNEFGARFFLSVALVVQLLLVYKTSFLLFSNKKTALFSVVLYFSTPLVLGSVRNLTTDAYLNTFVMMAVYFWLRHLKSNTFTLLFYISLGLGFLTKGPLVLLPILLFQASWYYFNGIKIRFSWYDALGVLVLVGTCGWWYLIIIQENPLVLDYFINEQLYGRVANKDAFNRGKPLWYYFAFVPLTLFPWVVYLCFVFSKSRDTTQRRSKKKALVVSFVLIILLFSAFKTKLIFYILPSVFLLAIYCAEALKDLNHTTWKKLTRYLYVYFSFLIVAAVVAWGFGKIEIPATSISILCLGFLGSVLLIKISHGLYRNMAVLWIHTLSLLLFSNGVMGSNELLINSVKPMAEFVNTQRTKEVYVYNYLLPSLSFYTEKPVITLNNGNETSKRELQFEQNTRYKNNYYNLEDPEEIMRFKGDFKAESALFLIRKDETIPPFIQTQLLFFKQKKVFGKWMVYFN